MRDTVGIIQGDNSARHCIKGLILINIFKYENEKNYKIKNYKNENVHYGHYLKTIRDTFFPIFGLQWGIKEKSRTQFMVGVEIQQMGEVHNFGH